MTIAAFDYRPLHRRLQAELQAAIADVLESGQLILGPRVAAFEEHFTAYLDAPGHSVGVANGTDALALALRALGVGPGDEVLTVANTAVATACAVRMAGATPTFCDVDPQTLLMDPLDAAARITPRTKVLLPVHLFGNAVDMDAIHALAERRNLRVVEDCAQACGTTFRGRKVGTWGDIGCFSFYPTKNLGAYGDGGLCFTANAALAERLRMLRMYGCDAERQAVVSGANSRLDELQAAILDVKLRHLPAALDERAQLAAVYREHLPPQLPMPQETLHATRTYHLLVIQAERREALIERLNAAHIGYGIHYPTPLYRMPAYRLREPGEIWLPVTEAAARRVLSLPLYPGLAIEAVREVCATLAAA